MPLVIVIGMVSPTDICGSVVGIVNSMTVLSGALLQPAYSLFGEVATGFDETVVAMDAAGTDTGTQSEPIEIQSVVISTN